ncbi:MAG TPA: transposase, partial [Methylococcaceae bacterium]|nr:transposase [Methylococcaceae bacterium]
MDSNTYLLKTYRDIEMNPEATAMVDRPEAYQWSSYDG